MNDRTPGDTVTAEPRTRTYGRGRFIITVREHPPFYGPEEIGDLIDAVRNGGDPRIRPMREPAVNATSALLKARGNEVSDSMKAAGKRRIEAGIGDSNDGFSVRTYLKATNDAAGHQLFDLVALAAAGVDLDQVMHFAYGAMQGDPKVLDRLRDYLGRIVGFKVRDYLVNAHGGRANATLSLRACREAMTLIWREKRAAAKKAMKVAKQALAADPHNEELQRSHTAAVVYHKKFTTPKAAAVTKTWGTYEDIIVKELGDSGFVRIECPDGVPDPKLIEAACSEDPNIGFIIFCNPNNPTGKRMTSEQATDLCFVLERFKLFCHEDDIYCSKQFVAPHRSVLWAAANLVMNPASKSVAIWVACHTTMAVGWSKFGDSGGRHYTMIIPNSRLRGRFVGFMGANYGPAPRITQHITIAMLEEGDDVRAWNSINQKRIKLCDALADLADLLDRWGITLEWSGLDGGFYTWLRFVGVKGLKYTNRNRREKVVNTGLQLAKMLVERAWTIVAPDEAALTVDPEGLRIAFGSMDLDDIAALPVQLGEAIISVLKENGRTEIQA